MSGENCERAYWCGCEDALDGGVARDTDLTPREAFAYRRGFAAGERARAGIDAGGVVVRSPAGVVALPAADFVEQAGFEHDGKFVRVFDYKPAE